MMAGYGKVNPAFSVLTDSFGYGLFPMILHKTNVERNMWNLITTAQLLSSEEQEHFA
jgi:hypothetical protein